MSTVFPGARSAEQARSDAAAGEVGPVSGAVLAGVRDLYHRRLRSRVHHRW